jgi:hypothetical protein
MVRPWYDLMIFGPDQREVTVSKIVSFDILFARIGVAAVAECLAGTVELSFKRLQATTSNSRLLIKHS